MAPPSSIENWLLCNRLRAVADRVAADPADAPAAWAQAERDIEAAGADEDADIALPVLEQSEEMLRALISGWDDGTAHMAEWDRAVLKRALKAYRKRLRLLRLDDESSASRNPLSKGDESTITGCKPPEQYPDEVWAMLVAQGKLRDAGNHMLELATEG